MLYSKKLIPKLDVQAETATYAACFMMAGRVVSNAHHLALIAYAVDQLCASAPSISTESLSRIAYTPSICFASSGRHLRREQTASVHPWIGTECLDVQPQHSCSYRLDTRRSPRWTLHRTPSNDMVLEPNYSNNLFGDMSSLECPMNGSSTSPVHLCETVACKFTISWNVAT